MAIDGKIIVNDRDAGREDVTVLDPDQIKKILNNSSEDRDTFTK